MKLILVNQRYGHTRTIVIRGWMKGLLSLCLLGAPVALGYLGYELALADSASNALISQEKTVSSDEFIRSHPKTAVPIYQSALIDSAATSVRSADNYHHTLVAAHSVISPPALQAIDAYVTYGTQTLAVFAHGRHIDAAVYSSHTLH
jgi:hypothetical protein